MRKDRRANLTVRDPFEWRRLAGDRQPASASNQPRLPFVAVGVQLVSKAIAIGRDRVFRLPRLIEQRRVNGQDDDRAGRHDDEPEHRYGGGSRYTIRRAAEILGEDETLLWGTAADMEPEGGRCGFTIRTTNRPSPLRPPGWILRIPTKSPGHSEMMSPGVPT